MSPAARVVPVLPAPCCPAGCRPVALVDRSGLLGLSGEPPGGPCPWCLEACRDAIDRGRPARPLVPRAGRRLRGGRHELEPARPDEIVERLAGVLSGRARAILWVEPETRPGIPRDLPARVAALGTRVHLLRVPEAGRDLARRLAALLPADRRVSPAEARPGEGDLVLLWDVDAAAGWAREAAWADAAARRGAQVVRIGPLVFPGEDGFPLPPGWDGALALGFAARDGAPAPGGWSRGRVAAETGVGEEELHRLARRLAECRRGYLVPGTPLAASSPETLAALATLVEARHLRVVLPPVPRDEETGAVRWVDPDHPFGVLDELDPRHTLVLLVEVDPLAFLPGASRLAAFLDEALLVTVFGPWRGPAGRRADLVDPLPGLLARDGMVRVGQESWEGRAVLDPGGFVDVGGTWRRVGRRLGAPGTIFDPDVAPVVPAGVGEDSLPREATMAAERWRPDPDLATGRSGALVVLGRRWPPEIATWAGLPRVRVGPGTAEARGLHGGQPACLHAGEGRLGVRVEIDPAVPEGMVLCGILPAGGAVLPGVLGRGPWRVGAAAPFRGELFPDAEEGSP